MTNTEKLKKILETDDKLILTKAGSRLYTYILSDIELRQYDIVFDYILIDDKLKIADRTYIDYERLNEAVYDIFQITEEFRLLYL